MTEPSDPPQPPQSPPASPWGLPESGKAPATSPWGAPKPKPGGSVPPTGHGAGSNPFGNRGEPPRPTATPTNDLGATLQRLLDHIRGLLNGGPAGSGNRRPPPRGPHQPQAPHPLAGVPPHRIVSLALAGLVALWLVSGFTRVQEGQLGVVLRFGQVVRTAPPGLRYHIPYPVETMLTPNVTFENRTEIGFRSSHTEGDRAVPDESVMLTADQNIVDLDFAVTWVVKDAKQYLFEIRDPEATVKRAAESAMREVIGQTAIQAAITDARDQIQADTKTQLQQILDSYDSGVEIVRVELLRVNPPGPVVDAFNDVQRAEADRERARNEAEAYRNKIIPEARGEAERLRNEAQGYRQQVVNEATGEASRFSAVLAAYTDAPAVTAERLYLETMEDLLRGKRTFIGDGVRGTVPYLPLDPRVLNAEKAKP